MDLGTGEIRIGGEVEDPYDRFDPVRQDAAAMIGGRLMLMDETGTVYEQRDDTTSVLFAWRAGLDLQQIDAGADRFFRRTWAATFVHGIGHMWDADTELGTGGMLVAGGTRFRHDVRFEGALGGVFARQFGPRFRRALPLAMARLAEVAQTPPTQ